MMPALKQTLVGPIFTPCIAAAWLLTSESALRDCERTLSCSVLREKDLDEAFSLGSYTGPSRRTSIEGILQGLAALEVRDGIRDGMLLWLWLWGGREGGGKGWF